MDSPFSIEVSKTKNSQKVIVSGELIINHISSIKEKLIETLDFSKKLSVKVINPSSLDITFIQVLLAIKASYKVKELDLEVEGTLNEEVFLLVANAGFEDLFKL